MNSKHFYLGIFFILFLFSCGSKEGKIKKNESVEPNDQIQDANPIDFGTDFLMSIFPVGDIDWYSVDVKEQGYIEVMTKDIPEGLDIQVRFALYDEWGSKKEDFITNYMKTPAIISVTEPGTYYIMILERWGQKESDQEFSVKINFLKEMDTHEPNNDVLTAKQIEFEKEYQSAIFPLNDEDWFKLELTEQGYVHIKSKDAPGDVKLAAFISRYDEYGSKKIKTYITKEEVPFVFAISEPGDYYLVLCDLWGNKYSKEVFTWQTEFIPEMDIYEPNNDFENATPIYTDSVFQIAIFPIGDSDIFKFAPKNKGKLEIKSNNTSNIDLRVKIYQVKKESSEKPKQLKGSEQLPMVFEINDLEKDYYFEFHDQWNKKASKDLFELVFKFE